MRGHNDSLRFLRGLLRTTERGSKLICSIYLCGLSEWIQVVGPRFPCGHSGEEVLKSVIVLPLCAVVFKSVPFDMDGNHVILTIGIRGIISQGKSIEVAAVRGIDV